MDYSEKLVVNGLRKGDTEAFKYLYDTHYQVLCHFASRYLRDDYLAESVVGDVMFHLWENHERIEVEVSLRSYLIRCVRNSCLDLCARIARNTKSPPRPSPLLQTKPW